MCTFKYLKNQEKTTKRVRFGRVQSQSVNQACEAALAQMSIVPPELYPNYPNLESEYLLWPGLKAFAHLRATDFMFLITRNIWTKEGMQCWKYQTSVSYRTSGLRACKCDYWNR